VPETDATETNVLLREILKTLKAIAADAGYFRKKNEAVIRGMESMRNLPGR
jgi:hypothetical protein